MKKEEVGVITEQATPAGKFGFNPVDKRDRDKLKNPADDKRPSDKG